MNKLITILLLNKFSKKKGGIQPSGTINIIENGTYNVTEYAEANVNITSDYNIKGIDATADGVIFRNIISEIKDNSIDFGTRTNISGFFQQIGGLVKAPKLDLSNMTDISYLFNQCQKLEILPFYNIPNVTNMSTMLNNVKLLDNESLNNVLKMCISAVSYTGTKELRTLGMLESTAQKCLNLPDYQNFKNAGWKTGFNSLDNV